MIQDPFMVTTIAFGITTIGAGAIALRNAMLNDWNASKVIDLSEANQDLTYRVFELERTVRSYRSAEADRVSRLSAAGKAGRAAQIARQKSPDAKAAAAAASEKTLAAFKTTALRPRDKVVAPVRAKRAKAKAAAQPTA